MLLLYYRLLLTALACCVLRYGMVWHGVGTTLSQFSWQYSAARSMLHVVRYDELYDVLIGCLPVVTLYSRLTKQLN